jgi:hypothetical protein
MARDRIVTDQSQARQAEQIVGRSIKQAIGLGVHSHEGGGMAQRALILGAIGVVGVGLWTEIVFPGQLARVYSQLQQTVAADLTLPPVSEHIEEIKRTFKPSFEALEQLAKPTSDAEDRAEQLLQDQLDQLNAKRYTAGLPLLTLDDVRRQREQNIRMRDENAKALQAEMRKIEAYKAAHGGCIPGSVPVPAGGTRQGDVQQGGNLPLPTGCTAIWASGENVIERGHIIGRPDPVGRPSQYEYSPTTSHLACPAGYAIALDDGSEEAHHGGGIINTKGQHVLCKLQQE